MCVLLSKVLGEILVAYLSVLRLQNLGERIWEGGSLSAAKVAITVCVPLETALLGYEGC